MRFPWSLSHCPEQRSHVLCDVTHFPTVVSVEVPSDHFIFRNVSFSNWLSRLRGVTSSCGREHSDPGGAHVFHDITYFPRAVAVLVASNFFFGMRIPQTGYAGYNP